MNYAPIHLRILLHYYTTPGDFPEQSPAVAEARERLTEDGLLEKTGPDEDTWRQITEKGKAHVEALCRLPLPEQQWVTPV